MAARPWRERQSTASCGNGAVTDSILLTDPPQDAFKSISYCIERRKRFGDELDRFLDGGIETELDVDIEPRTKI